ncbi:hypothetical protein DPMN_149771 [Dreissena polymorpha]|uniref:Uncharacterized protein n=1 Tax=Dreissena polymorpha TaxID=45954 RepID=A0A9D4J5A9_DREPO|nr:hypothetical protein DPMN_149771 [Dreissena polymorpha]
MQAAETARNRNNGISRVWGRVFVAEKTLSIGIAERKYQSILHNSPGSRQAIVKHSLVLLKASS